MLKGCFNLSHLSAGFTAILIGYTSSVVIVIQAATVAGATPEQIESWLLVLGVAMGLTSIAFSWLYKVPVLTAWSTPGAAMLAGAAGQYDLPVVIGAFIITGGLIFLTGVITPLSRALERIPPQLGCAMLAAILLPFCLKAFTPITTSPLLFFCMFASYLSAKQLVPRYSMVVLLIVGIICSILGDAFVDQTIGISMANPIWVTPSFDLLAMLNLSIPLYVVTMLSQNLPGITMMRGHRYHAPVKPLLIGTGLIQVLLAPFGCFSVNLAAISAAICMNENVDPDKSLRYRSTLWAGFFYLIAGVWAGTVVSLFLALPSEVSHILAGLALLGTLLMCIRTAFTEARYQEGALLTFLITFSGVSFLGISATLWGLLAGFLVIRLSKRSLA